MPKDKDFLDNQEAPVDNGFDMQMWLLLDKELNQF